MRSPPVPLAEVTRGPLVESVHYGHVAAVTGDGHLAFALGDPEEAVYLRSSAKPFQVLPVLLEGAADRYGFTDPEIALACGSHEGEPVHQDTARQMLEKAGLTGEALRCGITPPLDEKEKKKLEQKGEEPSTLHNECSGKHAAMVALARHLGAPLDTYLEADHPVQQRMREVVARFADVNGEAMPTGIDGCRLPTFAVPLRAAALMFARLVAPPADWEEPTKAACGRVVRAMTTHPEMVDGTNAEELLDSAVMRAGRGLVVSKMGAEGLYAAGVPPCERWPTGLGLAVKVADGDNEERARSPIAVALLHHLGALADGDLDVLSSHRTKPVTSNEDEVVGEVRPAPTLTSQA
ncbi:MAG TPA: asparaginase [Rubricoccaceae bacterium]|nr:asparaginase [Rubricoccaceae bacterium]